MKLDVLKIAAWSVGSTLHAAWTGFMRSTIPHWLTLKWYESRKWKRILEQRLSITVSQTLYLKEVGICAREKNCLLNFPHRAKSETSVTATSAPTSRLCVASAPHQILHNRFSHKSEGVGGGMGGSCVAWGNTFWDISPQNYFPFLNTDVDHCRSLTVCFFFGGVEFFLMMEWP